MYKILGIINVILVVIITSPFWLRTLNKWTIKTKDKRFLDLIKFLRKLHKPFAILLALNILVHAYLALNGTFRLHTGLLAYIGFLLTVTVGGIYYKKKGKTLFKIHKTLALTSVVLVLIHLAWPEAIWQIFGI
jgi:cytochrome b561